MENGDDITRGLPGVRIGVRLSKLEKRKLDELARWWYPTRERMHSIVIGECIIKAWAEEAQKREAEAKEAGE